MQERVLIVNSDGLFSALPSIEEFNSLNYITAGKLVCRVKVNKELLPFIRQESARIRILSPALPLPPRGESWLFLAAVKGELIRV